MSLGIKRTLSALSLNVEEIENELPFLIEDSMGIEVEKLLVVFIVLKYARVPTHTHTQCSLTKWFHLMTKTNKLEIFSNAFIITLKVAMAYMANKVFRIQS